MNRSAYYIEQAKRRARIANGPVDDTRKERPLAMASENAFMAEALSRAEGHEALSTTAPAADREGGW
jgi:hypothetical protein